MAVSISNPDHLKAAIDEGKAGDKIAFPDPAAAPLGTDAEAAGFPPTAGEIALDAASVASPAKSIAKPAANGDCSNLDAVLTDRAQGWAERWLLGRSGVSGPIRVMALIIAFIVAGGVLFYVLR